MNRLSSASHFLRGAGSLIEICPGRIPTRERLGRYYPYSLRRGWEDRVLRAVGLSLLTAMEEVGTREPQKEESTAP